MRKRAYIKELQGTVERLANHMALQDERLAMALADAQNLRDWNRAIIDSMNRDHERLRELLQSLRMVRYIILQAWSAEAMQRALPGMDSGIEELEKIVGDYEADTGQSALQSS